MENGKESVYPSEKWIDGGHPMLDDVKIKTKGLTKREHFAGQILAGMMLNTNHVEDHIVYAQQAVAYADALLEALSEP